MRHWVLFGLILLLLDSTTCKAAALARLGLTATATVMRQQAPTPAAKLAALEKAKQAGLLSEAEYARKKAEIEAQGRPPVQLDAATRKKLEALEKAKQAGILSEAEYTRKKAEIEAQARPPVQLDAATRKKLEALEKAKQAGLLSEAEYARKKAEITGGPDLPAGVSRYRDGRRGYEFRHPISWELTAFPNDRGVALTQGRSSINLLIFDDARSTEDLIASIAKSIRTQWQGFRELGHGQQVVAGSSAPGIEFEGVNPRGLAVKSSLTAILRGGSGYAFMLTAEKSEFDAARPVLEMLLASFWLGQAAPTKRAGHTYRHVAGFTFWYPSSWTVKEHDTFLQLLPADPGSRPEGPTESYFIVGDTVAGEGITRPDDPRVVAYMDKEVRSLLPAMQQVGQVGSVPMSTGQGAVITWETKNDRNEVLRAEALVCIIKEHGMALLSLGLADQVAKRQDDVRKMFGSFGIGSGQRDQQIVGVWGLFSTRGLSNQIGYNTGSESSYTMARSVSDNNSVLELRADGTWVRTDTSEWIAMGAHNPITGTNIILGGDGPTKTVHRGTWNAGGGILFMIWQDGSWEDYKYQLIRGPKGSQLKISSEKTVEVWSAR